MNKKTRREAMFKRHREYHLNKRKALQEARLRSEIPEGCVDSEIIGTAIVAAEQRGMSYMLGLIDNFVTNEKEKPGHSFKVSSPPRNYLGINDGKRYCMKCESILTEEDNSKHICNSCLSIKNL